MSQDQPALALIYEDSLPDALFDEFVDEALKLDVPIFAGSTPTRGPMAMSEWVVPTMVVLFLGVTKLYFGEYIKETAKEHRQKLKPAFATLFKKFFGKDRAVTGGAIGRPGKVDQNFPYNRLISLISQAKDGSQIKLMILERADVDQAVSAADEFVDILLQHHFGDGNDEISQKIEERPSHRYPMLCVRYDEQTGKGQVFDPMEEQRQKVLARQAAQPEETLEEKEASAQKLRELLRKHMK